METFKKIVSFLRTLPVWSRIVAIVVVAAVAALSLFSCSSVWTVMKSPGEIRTSVNQSTLDSARVTIDLFNTRQK